MKKPFSIRTTILAASLLLLLDTFCFHSNAAVGDVDLSFDPGSGVNDTVNAIAVQSDGKVLIAGQFTTVKGLARRGIARLNADGSSDSSFDAAPVVLPNLYSPQVYGVAVQPDGKVMIGQNFGVTRHHADGSRDHTFNFYSVGGNYTRTTAFALQLDGKVLVAGYTVTEITDPEGFIDFFYSYFVTRANANGSRDTSFTASEGPNYFVESIALQADGKVLVAGNFSTVHGTNRSRIARLHADGSLDSSFVPATGANANINSVVAQPDGKVLIAGEFTSVNDTTRNRVARLNADGGLDSGFNPGTGVSSVVSSLALQPDGKVLIAGSFTIVDGTNRNRIARLNANGSLDTGFNPGSGADSDVNSVVVQPDGKVLLGGALTRFNGIIRSKMARLNADGSLDGSLHAGAGVSSPVYSLAVQPDGKTLIGGVFSSVQDLHRSGIARLNANGSVDSTFDPGTGVAYSPYWAGLGVPQVTVALQSDGRVLIGGAFASVDGTPRTGMARLHANGSLDDSFNVSLASGDPDPDSVPSVMAIAVQSDGKVLIGGGFVVMNGTNVQSGLARLNANGNLDGSFNPGVAGYVYSIVLQPDGKVLVGGTFNLTNNSRNGVFRLNANGSVDSSFNGGAEVFGYVTSIALQSDGKVLVAGAFSAVNGTNRTAIARLNSDGALDANFNPDIASDFSDYPVVNSLAVRPDGRVLMGGAFSTVNGTNRSGIARLNYDGTLDASFNPGAGVAGYDHPVVHSLALQPDGNVLIGGDFTTVNGMVRPHVARLIGDAAFPRLTLAPSGGSVILSWPVTALNIQLQEATDLSVPNAWSPVTQPAVETAGQLSVNVPITTGNRFFRLVKP